jgi:hypothetical protein
VASSTVLHRPTGEFMDESSAPISALAPEANTDPNSSEKTTPQINDEPM